MKKIFTFFLALIFINLSCSKRIQTFIFKRYIFNQTQHDVSLTFDDISINLLKNSSDSFEYRETFISVVEFSRVWQFYYKNKKINNSNINVIKINFNNKKIQLKPRERYSFIRIKSKNFPETVEHNFRYNLNSFYFAFGDDMELYLLPSLYDSAK